MDVTIFGKALTPISHECLLHLPQSVRENDYRNKKVPYYKCYTDLKSMQIYHGEDKHEQHWNPKFEKTRMNLSPIFRNMTLSETYNFAREQLKRYPSQTSTRITEQPCNFQFRKVHDCNINQETTTEKQSQKFKPDVVIASSGGAASEKTTETSLLDAEIYSRKVQHRAKSVVGHLKKSARRKKKSPNLKKELKNEEITLSKFMRGEKISPIRTSASMPSRLNTVTSCKNSTVQPFTNLATHRVKPLTTHGVRRTTALPQQTRQSLDKSIGCKVDDLLLSSLGMKIHHYCRERNSRVKIFVTDASPNKRKSSRELSMRIQLIHRYGNEDVITKHMEMKKKREIANRHEAKNLELQANERRKEQQRLKIYALNKLMTRLEQEQFEEYKQRL